MAQDIKYYLHLDGVDGWSRAPGLQDRGWLELLWANIPNVNTLEVRLSYSTGGGHDLFQLSIKGDPRQGKLAGLKNGAVVQMLVLDGALVESYRVAPGGPDGPKVELTLNCVQIRSERGSLSLAASA